MSEDAADRQRRALGFLTIAETLALAARGNQILDPHSILIAAAARIGSGNRFYPGVTVEAGAGAAIAIGDGNLFWPGSTIAATAGTITIGDRNQFGPGGFTASLDGAGGLIAIGSGGRFRDGAAIGASTTLGSGAQVLGPIQVQGSALAAGGGHDAPDPDARGGVLKGAGRARGLAVGQGQVIEGHGHFDMADLKPQSFYHPPTRAGGSAGGSAAG
jgi:hypothetical protein